MILLAVFLIAAQSPMLTTKHAGCGAPLAAQTAPDVAYKPGIATGGRPVAPADMEGGLGPKDFPAVGIYLAAPVAGVETPQGRPGISDAQVGLAEVDTQTGATRINGKEIGAGQPSSLTEGCPH